MVTGILSKLKKKFFSSLTIHDSSKRICKQVDRQCVSLSPRRTLQERMREKTETTKCIGSVKIQKM